MSEHEHPATENPYLQVVLGEGSERWPDLADEWDELWTLLTEGTYTHIELIAMTGLSRGTVRALTYYGKKTGKVALVPVTREVEVAPDLWVFQTARGFRATLRSTS